MSAPTIDLIVGAYIAATAGTIGLLWSRLHYWRSRADRAEAAMARVEAEIVASTGQAIDAEIRRTAQLDDLEAKVTAILHRILTRLRL